MRRLLVPVLLAAAAMARAGAGPLGDDGVERLIGSQHLPPSSVSYLVTDVDTGRVILRHDASTPRSPGSVIKLVTTFAALDTLGPEFKWQTRALATAPLQRGVLRGDLYLQGGGDPYMTLDRWWRFARALRDRGLRTIRGDIVIDDTAFEVGDADPAAFDGHPNRPYNVAPSALMINFQTVTFRVTPDPQARQVAVSTDPTPVNLRVDNRLRLVRGRCAGRGDSLGFTVGGALRRDHVVLSGALAERCAPREMIRALMQAPQFAYGTFAELWRELGGRITGAMRIGATPADARTLLDFDSLSLAEIVRLTNKYSNNLMARDLLLTLGAQRFGAPATVAKGVDAITAWSRARGLPLADTVLRNGSGLSRATRISAATLTAVLRAAYHDRFAPEFLVSLPLAGIDGTLRTRMKDTPPGAVRLKTGTLDGVSSVAGYVSTARGHTYVLVSFVNDPRADAGAGEAVHQALVDWILAHG
ncbi:MAG: D-alanyl-D-alanine carboxypeptidase/D-alanyl-D-alanine-endopeptidase [Gammaproteobacteria bacterium]|nr:D-alanyl-D-alanine carboxypeptidase/D-alanyl-D-alanine-endopeptidase [Gammaproteobacteria bacterium]MDE2349719.1 D-alanyl-D-alanine carboxypeptidase/D-alanyl-D-alanine-endopeptidase [Gammaproteobacteria bacterium]